MESLIARKIGKSFLLWLSLTPNFSWVSGASPVLNRFNGFLIAPRVASTAQNP
jgi:hypothetical protein